MFLCLSYHKIMEIILASNSPRRKDLLKKAGYDFCVVSPDFEENLDTDIFSYELIENLAYNKAKSLLNENTKNKIIIGADTVVVVDKKILGKPFDKNEAIKMLKMLNNRTHIVVTSMCVLHPIVPYKRIKSTTSEVTFNNLSDEQILDYIEKFNPVDKAGAYGIQELPDYFVKTIVGYFDNIVGFPCETLQELLK